MMGARTKMLALVAGLLTATAIPLAGCAGSAENAGRSAPGTQQGVADVMREQMRPEVEQAPVAGQEPFDADTAPTFGSIDYDLTAMGPEMVYATVFDMMQYPEHYKGKVVRMEGPFYHTFFEPTETDYFYVIIQDATACCSQGLEFVWDDGSHTYPDEYPAAGTEVIVTGRFETYTEESSRYVHLVDASLETLEPSS